MELVFGPARSSYLSGTREDVTPFTSNQMVRWKILKARPSSSCAWSAIGCIGRFEKGAVSAAIGGYGVSPEAARCR